MTGLREKVMKQTLFVEFGAVLRFYGYFYGFWSSFCLFYGPNWKLPRWIH